MKRVVTICFAIFLTITVAGIMFAGGKQEERAFAIEIH